MGPRRALIFASGSRYVVALLQICATFVVARHVAPDQFGIAVLGGGALLLAEAIRELGSVAYLVQAKELARDEVRSAFTLSLIVTALVTAALVVAAPGIAAFYRDARLGDFLRVMAIGYALGPFVHPVQALLSRDMAFHRIAAIDVAAAVVNAAAAILLVRAGYGFMAVAWANVAAGATGMLLGFWYQRDFGIFRPSLAAWRGVLGFGVHGSATAMVYRLGEAMLFLSLGRAMDARAVGLIQRGYLLAQLPERVLLAGVGAVAMPAFAELARRGEPLAPAYARSIAMLNAVHMPALVTLAVLARPLVAILLGPAWSAVVPLVQIMALGIIPGFANTLNVMVLIAAGGIRQTTPLALIQMAVLIAATLIAAPHGVTAVAWTAFVTSPAAALAAIVFLRRRVDVGWRAVAGVVARTAIVAAATAAGPLALALATGWAGTRPAALLAGGALLAALGWIVALAATRNPLFDELGRALALLRRRAIG